MAYGPSWMLGASSRIRARYIVAKLMPEVGTRAFVSQGDSRKAAGRGRQLLFRAVGHLPGASR